MTDRTTVVRWGIRFEGDVEPYDVFDTEADAIAAYEGMKLKHRAAEEVVRVETTITVVRDANEAHHQYMETLADWEGERT